MQCVLIDHFVCDQDIGGRFSTPSMVIGIRKFMKLCNVRELIVLLTNLTIIFFLLLGVSGIKYCCRLFGL